jgi:hypothetical protein
MVSRSFADLTVSPFAYPSRGMNTKAGKEVLPYCLPVEGLEYLVCCYCMKLHRVNLFPRLFSLEPMITAFRLILDMFRSLHIARI